MTAVMAFTSCAEDAKLLLTLTPTKIKALLKVLDVRRIRSICECAHNLLRGNIPVRDKCKLKKLHKHKALLRKLAARGESLTKKRRYLVQKGGGIILPLLLNAALQAAASYALSR